MDLYSNSSIDEDSHPNPPELSESRLKSLSLDEEPDSAAAIEACSDQAGSGGAANGSVDTNPIRRDEMHSETLVMATEEAVEEGSSGLSREFEVSNGGSFNADFGGEDELRTRKEGHGHGSGSVQTLLSEIIEEEVRDNSSSGIVWRGVSELEFDGLSSPSSSGYAGERGSSSASTTSEIQEVDDVSIDGVVPGVDSINAVPDSDEDDDSISWRKRKKHFLVLSNSGRPIYSRYGDELKLAGFSATLQAIIAFVENGGDRVKFVRAGKHQVVFLVKGPIYLVCISCTEEPYEALRGQLELVYGQMVLILTKSVNRCFEKNPKFDMMHLLGGTEAVFSSLIHAFSRNPATFLHAYTCLPLAYPTRQAAGAVLQDIADSGVLFAILMCKHKVVSLVGAQKASLHPDDMLLLANFVSSSDSFRTSESFSPICLPKYNPMAFLYAYVHYFDEIKTLLVY
ncbi:hypothetical protein Syun_001384 [Stephania yunnanensis]|uniref:Vacuolar fusion protein MON1 homolog n=1 Tax=Stephania yunnanensis TaxID=152371 RepID=A0AAP0LHP4_9MAGN